MTGQLFTDRAATRRAGKHRGRAECDRPACAGRAGKPRVAKRRRTAECGRKSAWRLLSWAVKSSLLLIRRIDESVEQEAGGAAEFSYIKEQLMAAIAEVTEKLGHVPSHAELMRSGKVSGRQIVKHLARIRERFARAIWKGFLAEQTAAGKAVSGLGKSGTGG